MRVDLVGCPFQPLGAYLKALAVLRLASQADKGARGFWNGRFFVIESEFDQDGLVDFFLSGYRPTPALAPWKNSSGFYSDDREESKVGLNAILATTSERFATYRADLQRAFEIVEEVGERADEGERRRDIVRLCRNRLSDACVEWLDAVIAISSSGSPAFAPILGTGGNDGNFDFTSNFMKRLKELLIAPNRHTPVRELLRNALFGTYSKGLQSIAVGQYDPGRSGGFNQGERIEAEAVANPWDAVLTLEGAAGWVGGIYRKQGAAYRSFLCSPFTVGASAVGYGSASGNDKENARAEIWAPLWGRPSRFREVAMLLREGRASVDGKPAQNGLEFAEAAGMLGVDRGIEAFVRYTLLKRRGKSFIALPVGKLAVQYRSTADLVRELTPFVDAAGRAAKGSGGEIPNSWPPLARAMDEAMFQALLHGRQDLLVNVAAAFGAMHRWLLLRNREVYWRGRLSSEWLKQLWEVDRPEVRIAAGVAAMRRHPDAGALLENLNPGGNHFCWTGADLSSRMLSTLRRRTLDAARSEQSPFWSRMLACPDDAVAFLERTVSDELIENLTFAFVLAEPPKDSPPPRNYRAARRWPAYCVLKQLFDASTHPSRNAREDEPRFRPDLAVSSWLAGGRVKDAVDFGIRRLQIAGLTPVIRQGQDSEDGPRLGAALLIPVWGVKGLRDL